MNDFNAKIEKANKKKGNQNRVYCFFNPPNHDTSRLEEEEWWNIEWAWRLSLKIGQPFNGAWVVYLMTLPTPNTVGDFNETNKIYLGENTHLISPPGGGYLWPPVTQYSIHFHSSNNIYTMISRLSTVSVKRMYQLSIRHDTIAGSCWKSCQ